MPQLSVIIVSYNVRPFLEQCLHSLSKALLHIEAEIWVVDNASNDDTVSFLQPRFPHVKWILNPVNKGFSKANNLALMQAKGNHVLFLNPDTLVPENCIENCLAFMKSHPDAGALGIHMIDGTGTFLPESKRGYPNILNSLFKLTGLVYLFPASKLFAGYYLGHLSPLETHEAVVLAGAFMLIKRDVLEQTGGFDERFFMYGEDIDLSYRINHLKMPDGIHTLKSYYYAGDSIIHFKGESTQKGSLNYIKMFYNAMAQFVEKHYARRTARIFVFFIYAGIAIRGLLTLLKSIPGHLFLLASKRFNGNYRQQKNGTSGAIDWNDGLVICGLGSKPTEANDYFRRIPAEHIRPVSNDAVPVLKEALQNISGKGSRNIIFFIDDLLSLKTVIPCLQKDSGLRYRFHYKGSKSIVGSDNKASSGQAVLLPVTAD